MTIPFTYSGSDDNALETLVTDSGVTFTHAGNIHQAVDALSIVMGVNLPFSGSDRNMQEALAAAYSGGAVVYGLDADLSAYGVPTYETHDSKFRQFSTTLASDAVQRNLMATRATYGTTGDFLTGAAESGIIVLPFSFTLWEDTSAYDGSANGYQVAIAFAGMGNGNGASVTFNVGHAGELTIRVTGRRIEYGTAQSYSQIVYSDPIATEGVLIGAFYMDKATGNVGAIYKLPGGTETDLGFLKFNGTTYEWTPDGSGQVSLMAQDGPKTPTLVVVDNTEAKQDFSGETLNLRVYCDPQEINALGLTLPTGALDIQGNAI